MRPYWLGCPQWQHPNWNDRLPDGSSALARYSRVFNCVEGNTTFYATPSHAQCEQWRSQVPDDFRFQFKFPRAISHDRLLGGVGNQTAEFLDILAPWVQRVADWVQDGLRPYMFIHMPDNGDALALAELWHGMLAARLPGLEALPLVRQVRQVDQPGLF